MQPSNSASSAVADGLTRIIIIALAALVPFFLAPLPYVAIPQSKIIVLAPLLILALLMWSYARLSEGTLHVPRSWLVYVSVLLPIAYLASALMTGWNSTSLVGQGFEQDTLVAVSLMCGLFLLTAFAFFGNSAATKMLIQGIVPGLVALFALDALYIFFPAWFNLGVLSGQTANLLGSWHDLGILAGLSFFVSFVLLQSGYYEGWKRVIPVLLSLLSLFFLIVIHFDDVFWGAAALFLVAFAASLRAALLQGLFPTLSVRKSALWLLVALLLAAAGFFGTTVWDTLPAPINIVQTEVRPSWQGTFDVAKQSLRAPSDVIFGTGPNSFIREWGLHKPASVNQTPFWDSDFNYGVGIIPTSIFNAGAIGLLAWALTILVMLGLVYRNVRESRPFTGNRVFLGVALLSAAYLVVYHMIYTPGIALTAGTFIALGILAIAAAGDSPARAIRIGVSSLGSSVRLFLFILLILAMIAAASLMLREVVSNIFVNRGAYLYQTKSDTQGASAMIGKALLVSPRNDRAHRAAAELGIIQLSKQIAQTDPNNKEATERLQATLQETIQHGLTAVSIDNTNYQNWLLLAQVYSNLAGANIKGALEQAKNAYEKAFEAHPTNPVPKLRLAQLSVASGDRAAARMYLQEAIQLKPDFAAAHFLLSQVEASDGKGDAAVQAASNAVQLVPQDPLGWFNLGYILYAGASYQNAARALAQAVNLAPDYSNALFYLGLSLYQLGNKADAAVAFDRVAQLNPSEKWVKQIATNIRAGKEPMAGIQQAK